MKAKDIQVCRNFKPIFNSFVLQTVSSQKNCYKSYVTYKFTHLQSQLYRIFLLQSLEKHFIVIKLILTIYFLGEGGYPGSPGAPGFPGKYNPLTLIYNNLIFRSQG